MLFYLGYLTIEGQKFNYPKLNIPNKAMKEIYSDYFLKILNEETELSSDINYAEIVGEIANEFKLF